MKKNINYVIIIMTIITGISELHGQKALDKGVYSISGTAQYSSSSEDNNNNTVTQNIGNISPQFTYFVANHISLGVAVNYNYYFIKGMYYSNSGAHNIKYTSIAVGPAFRYYFEAKKIIPFLEASFNYGVYGIESDYPEHTYDYGLKGGIEIFLSKSVALEPSVGYSRIHYTIDISNYSRDSDNIDLGIGISYFIF